MRTFNVLAWMVMITAAANAAEFHVRPGGDETFARALEQARALRRQQPPPREPVRIVVHGGTHVLTQPLRLTPEDSGTADALLVIEAAAESTPVLSGGERVTGWRVESDGRWRAKLAAEDGRGIVQLFVNDQRRYRARLPKRGWFHVAGELPPTEPNAKKGYDRFTFAGDDIRPDYAGSGAEVLAIHTWSATRMPISGVNAAEKTVAFPAPTRTLSPWGKYKKGGRYIVENVREALSEPGEFYHDVQAGELIYIPRPGETPDNTTIIAPRLTKLLTITGDAATGRRVEHVIVRGLHLAHSGWTLPPHGQSFPQAEVNVEAAVQIRGARHVTLDRCTVRHTGGYAISFEAGAEHCAVTTCEMLDLGAGGVKIGLTGGAHSWPIDKTTAAAEQAAVHHITVRDCTIAHGGRLHAAAVGVWIGHASHNSVTHNEIFDFYYTAVSVGWTWGYAASPANHNDIGFNRLHTLGQGVLSDMAGVYTLGVSPGTAVHDNVIHDVDCFEYGGWGLYTDEGSTGIVMTRNLVYRTDDGGFHQHYGRDNQIINNIFIDSAGPQIKRTRVEEHNSFTFARNIVQWQTAGELIKGDWKKNLITENNCYFRIGGEVVFPDKLALEAFGEKYSQERGSIVADPLLKRTPRGDYLVDPASPALKLGFELFDPARAGRLTERMTHLPTVPPAFW